MIVLAVLIAVHFPLDEQAGKIADQGQAAKGQDAHPQLDPSQRQFLGFYWNFLLVFLLILFALLLSACLFAAGAGRDADEETLRAAGVGIDGPSLLQFFKNRTVTGTSLPAFGKPNSAAAIRAISPVPRSTLARPSARQVPLPSCMARIGSVMCILRGLRLRRELRRVFNSASAARVV